MNTQTAAQTENKWNALIAQRTALMAAGYASGRYPVKPGREAWLDDLVTSLLEAGLIAPDHDGRITITLDLRGGGLRHAELKEDYKLAIF